MPLYIFQNFSLGIGLVSLLIAVTVSLQFFTPLAAAHILMEWETGWKGEVVMILIHA